MGEELAGPVVIENGNKVGWNDFSKSFAWLWLLKGLTAHEKAGREGGRKEGQGIRGSDYDVLMMD